MVPAAHITATRRPRSDARDRILAAALELFARDGYEATSIRAIADRCGLTDAAVLYHFKSKRGILDALLVEPQIAAPPPLAGPWDPERVADALVELFLAWAPHFDLFRVILLQALGDDPETIDFNRRAVRTYQRLVRPMIEPYRGDESDLIVDALAMLTAGTLIDGIIRIGPEFSCVVATPEFRERLRRSILLALPPAASPAAVAGATA